MKWLVEHTAHIGNECLIWPFARLPNGYGAIRHEGKSPHRVMCMLAHGSPPTDKLWALHSCGNGHLGCVNPKHLYWGCRSQNAKDAVAHGSRTYANGEQHHSAVLTEDAVRCIRSREHYHGLGVELAREFGVHASIISDVRNGHTWTHLLPEP